MCRYHGSAARQRQHRCLPCAETQPHAARHPLPWQNMPALPALFMLLCALQAGRQTQRAAARTTRSRCYQLCAAMHLSSGASSSTTAMSSCACCWMACRYVLFHILLHSALCTLKLASYIMVVPVAVLQAGTCTAHDALCGALRSCSAAACMLQLDRCARWAGKHSCLP